MVINDSDVATFKVQFGDYFKITNFRELRYVLGILIEYDHTNQLIYLSQKSYFKQVLKHYGIINIYPVLTSLSVETQLSTSITSDS